jgi:NTE family protein
MRRLVKSEIRYLSFEGGGGSGNAYPGALTELETLGVLAYDPKRARLTAKASLTQPPTGIDWRMRGQIEGVSGASAGAINALFLSLGYTPLEVEFILMTNDFEEFFDDIEPGLIPCVGGFRYTPTTYDLAGFADEIGATPAGKVLNALTSVEAFGFMQRWHAKITGAYLASLWTFYLSLMVEYPESAAKKVIENMTTGKIAASVVYDYGIFPGIEIRRFFGKYISLAVERLLAANPRYQVSGTPGGQYGPRSLTSTATGKSFYDVATGTMVQTSEVTFRQHREIFGTRLVVTGTNFETQKSHIFSADTTPNFRVVDAVRISMSLPMIFKPMVIKTDADLKTVVSPGEPTPDHPLEGVWVDGGFLNNIPVGAFDELAGGQKHTLGLVVGQDGRTSIDSILDYFKAYPLGQLMGTGGSQLSSTTSDIDRIVAIGTTDPKTGESIDLLDFAVDPTVYANVNEQSKQTVRKFFATRVDPG